MPYPKPLYARIDWVLWLPVLFLALVVLIFVVGTHVVFAGGDVKVTWDQASDCNVVTGWELLVAPVTTQQPNPQPSDATVGVSIPKGQPPCGLGMTKTATVTAGVGPQRFWLRAVAGATKSAESNAANASLPLAPPGQLTVVP